MVNWTSFVLRYGLLSHDDVIIWKHFPCYWPFVRGIHRPRWIRRTQRPVTRRFDVFFDLRLNKRLSKQPWGWWFETLSRPLWRHRNVMTLSHYLNRFDSSSKVSCGIHVRYLTKTGYDINRFANYTCTCRYLILHHLPVSVMDQGYPQGPLAVVGATVFAVTHNKSWSGYHS